MSYPAERDSQGSKHGCIYYLLGIVRNANAFGTRKTTKYVPIVFRVDLSLNFFFLLICLRVDRYRKNSKNDNTQRGVQTPIAFCPTRET